MSFRSILICLFALFLCFSVIAISARKTHSPFTSNSVSKCNQNGEKTHAKGIFFHGKTLEEDDEPIEEEYNHEDDEMEGFTDVSYEGQPRPPPRTPLPINFDFTKIKWNNAKQEIDQILSQANNVNNADSYVYSGLNHMIREKEEGMRDVKDMNDAKPYLQKIIEIADNASAEAQIAKTKTSEAIESASKLMEMIANIQNKLEQAEKNNEDGDEEKRKAIQDAEKDGENYETEKGKVEKLLQEAETAFNKISKIYQSFNIPWLHLGIIKIAHRAKKEIEKAKSYQSVASEQKTKFSSILEEIEVVVQKSPTNAKNGVAYMINSVKEKKQNVERNIAHIDTSLKQLQEDEAKEMAALADIDKKVDTQDAVDLSNALNDFGRKAESAANSIESYLNFKKDNVNAATKAKHEVPATLYLYQTDSLIQSGTAIVQQLARTINEKEDAVAVLRRRLNSAPNNAKEDLISQLQKEESALATARQKKEMATQSVQCLNENKESVRNALNSIQSTNEFHLTEMETFVKQAQSHAEKAEKELQKLNEDLPKVKVEVEKINYTPKPSDPKGGSKVLPPLPKTQSGKTMNITLQNETSQNSKPKENGKEVTQSTPSHKIKKDEVQKETENEKMSPLKSEEEKGKPNTQTVSLNKTEGLSGNTTNQNITKDKKKNPSEVEESKSEPTPKTIAGNKSESSVENETEENITAKMEEHTKRFSDLNTLDRTATHSTSVWIISTLSVIILFLHPF